MYVYVYMHIFTYTYVCSLVCVHVRVHIGAHTCGRAPPSRARATKSNVNGKRTQMHWKLLDQMTCARARATNSNVNGAGMQNVVENVTYSDAVDAPLTLLLLYIRILFYLK
jgi:hypothetical protein